jgi:hypothetical protein
MLPPKTADEISGGRLRFFPARHNVDRLWGEIGVAVFTIRPTLDGQPVGEDLAELLRRDLEREVGATEAGGAPAPYAKGVALDVAAIAVTILTPQAVVALIGVLKAYFERDRSLEVEVDGGGWKVRLKSADARRMSVVDLADLIDRATTGRKRGKADAPRRPDRR